MVLRMNTENAPLDHQVMWIPVIQEIDTNLLHMWILMLFQERVWDMLERLVHRFLSCLARMHRRRIHARHGIIDIDTPECHSHRQPPSCRRHRNQRPFPYHSEVPDTDNLQRTHAITTPHHPPHHLHPTNTPQTPEM